MVAKLVIESDQVKYLGHIICNDMSDDDDIFFIQFNSIYFQHTLTFHTISTTSTLCAGKGAD